MLHRPDPSSAGGSPWRSTRRCRRGSWSAPRPRPGGDEIGGYLEHPLRLAGAEIQFFDPAAIETIFQATNRLPRKVNRPAHHALNAAAIGKSKPVSADHVEQALAEVT